MSDADRVRALVTAIRWIQLEAVNAMDGGDGTGALRRVYDRCAYELEHLNDERTA